MCTLAVADLSELLQNGQAILFPPSSPTYMQTHVLAYSLLLETSFMFMNGTGDQKHELELS